MSKKIYSLVWNEYATETEDGLEAARSKLQMLLEVLCLLFDSVGEPATPILSKLDSKIKAATASDVLDVDWAKSLIPLLSAGLDDKTIARELDISSSTLSRRIRDLMSIYGVHTRFQLGLHVARSGAVASQ